MVQGIMASVQETGSVVTGLPFTEYYLRPATWQDCSRLFEWANDPVTRTNAFSTGYIRYEGHVRWLHHRLKDPGTHLWMYCGWYDTPDEGLRGAEAPLGQCRLEAPTTAAVWDLDYHIAPAWRGHGLAVQMLRAMLRVIPGSIEVLRAVNHLDNVAGRKTVRRAGFQLVQTKDSHEDHRYRIDGGPL